MIENEEAACDHEKHLRQMEIIMVRDRNFRLKKMDRFVAEKADSATSESWQFGARDKLVTCHQFADFVERVRRRIEPLLVAAFDESDFAPVTFDDNPGVDPNEGEPPRHVIFFGRFKEKAVTGVIKFFKR